MDDRIQIGEIKKYCDELADHLRQTGQTKAVESLTDIVERFKRPSEVRQAVYALEQAVRRWLANPKMIPPDAHVQLSAQFLVDACRNALAQGVIHSLPPSPKEKARHLGRVAGITAAVGFVVIVVPALLLALGVDWLGWIMPKELPGTEVPRGQEIAVTVRLLASPPKLDSDLEVRLEAVGGGHGRAWDDLTVEPAERLWRDGIRHATLHVVRPAEVTGIQIAMYGDTVIGNRGTGTLLVYAPEDAAPGDYLIPLQGSYALAPVVCDPAAAGATASDAGADAGHATDAGAPTQEACTPHDGPTAPIKHSPVEPILIRVR